MGKKFVRGLVNKRLAQELDKLAPQRQEEVHALVEDTREFLKEELGLTLNFYETLGLVCKLTTELESEKV